METLFVIVSLNLRRNSSKEIWLLRGFCTVSLLLADLHLLKYSLFFGVKNLKSVSRIAAKIMEVNHTFPRCQLLYKQTREVLLGTVMPLKQYKRTKLMVVRYSKITSNYN